jgi:hypothetical protein
MGTQGGHPVPITASYFFSQYKKIKEFLADGTKGSQELKEAFHNLNEGFKKNFQPDQFKAALAANTPIPDDLEERLTSALIIFNREKALE